MTGENWEDVSPLDRLDSLIVAGKAMCEGRPREWVTEEFNIPHLHVVRLSQALRLLNNSLAVYGVSVETYRAVEAAIEDEWSKGEIQRTYGVTLKFLADLFPEYQGWTKLEGSQWGNYLKTAKGIR